MCEPFGTSSTLGSSPPCSLFWLGRLMGLGAEMRPRDTMRPTRWPPPGLCDWTKRREVRSAENSGIAGWQGSSRHAGGEKVRVTTPGPSGHERATAAAPGPAPGDAGSGKARFDRTNDPRSVPPTGWAGQIVLNASCRAETHLELITAPLYCSRVAVHVRFSRRSKRGCRRVCRDDRRCPPGLEPRHAVSRVSCYYRTRALTTLARAARFATAPRGSFRPLGREINNQTRTCRAGSSLLAARVDRVGGVLFQTRPSVGCIPDRPRGDWRRPRVGERDRRTLGVEGGGGSIRSRAGLGI